MIPLYDENPTHRPPIVTIALIVVNVLVYFAWQSQVGLEKSVRLAAFVPVEFAHAAVPGTKFLFTSMFMHGGIMHLLGNMWFLWIFGDNVENECGHVRYVLFYLLTGVAATLGYAFLNADSAVPLVGASGAISGVLGGYLVRHPNVRVRTLIPMGFFTRIVDLPAWMFLFIWIGFQVLSQTMSAGRHGGGGVAYMAHIAGFIAGVALIFVFSGSRSRVEKPRRY